MQSTRPRRTPSPSEWPSWTSCRPMCRGRPGGSGPPPEMSPQGTGPGAAPAMEGSTPGECCSHPGPVRAAACMAVLTWSGVGGGGGCGQRQAQPAAASEATGVRGVGHLVWLVTRRHPDPATPLGLAGRQPTQRATYALASAMCRSPAAPPARGAEWPLLINAQRASSSTATSKRVHTLPRPVLQAMRAHMLKVAHLPSGAWIHAGERRLKTLMMDVLGV
jgi:hypothetical protein